MEQNTENLIGVLLTPFKFTEILKRGFSIDQLLFLRLVSLNLDIEDICSYAKIANLKDTCVRKGLLTSDLKISLEGQSLLDFINTEDSIKLPRKKSTTGPIESFWKAFPSTDTFEHKGRKFAGSRALKTDKDNCRIKLEAIINEGEYTLDQIIKAVEYDVMQKKEQSVKTGQNKLTYIQNSLTYLRQRSFEPFIELIKEGKDIKQTENTNFDGINI